MVDKKRINKNTLTEKIIYKYYLEKLYTGTLEEKKKLVPKGLHSKISKLNMIVPEDSTLANDYIPDFVIYIKGDKKGIPIEIKWRERDLNKKNQVDSLKENNGFLVTFRGSGDDIPHVQLDLKEVRNWWLARSGNIFDDCVAQKTGIAKPQQSWVILLRGTTAPKNFQKMLNHSKGKRNKFWAFKTTRENMKSILWFEKGDEVIFIFAKEEGGNQNLKVGDQTKILVHSAYLTTITDPYYMRAGFSLFEEIRKNKETLEINEQKWPHFLDFIIDFPLVETTAVLTGNLLNEGIKTALIKSDKQNGCPVQLSKSDMDLLHSCLANLKKE